MASTDATTAPAPGDGSAVAFGGMSISSILQTIFAVVAMNMLVGHFFGNPTPAGITPDVNIPVAKPVQPITHSVVPIWADGLKLDIRMYATSSFILPPLADLPAGSLVLDERGFGYGDWNDKRTIHTTFKVPERVQNNGTLWVHCLVALAGADMDPSSESYDPTRAYHFPRVMSRYMAKKKVIQKRNLLAASDGSDMDELELDGPVASNEKIIRSYYHPNLTLTFVPSYGPLVLGQVAPPVFNHLNVVQDNPPQWYYPILFHNTFWQLVKDFQEIDTTVTELPINIELSNQAGWMFTILATLDASTRIATQQAEAGQGPISGSDGSEFEEIKRILLDGNPILLMITAVASVFHMIFEMLAFKNEVAHWREKKDNVGVSLRTILANVFMQLTIFLYLLDNNEHTSWIILFGQVAGIGVEAWKITKAVDVRIRPAPAGAFFPYTVKFEDKHKLSESEKKTEEYDAIAFTYLYKIAIPLLVAYAAYSLKYETHKSWYSFIIATLVGSVYAYGFLMMVPSLYINYRLKSVAHMARKAMVYKFLNTFIDDLFAFAIKMPTLHRIATLRDDIIFFVYLYQSWVYRVDYTRVNEFGQGGGDDATEAVEGEEVKRLEDKSEEKGEDVVPVEDISSTIKEVAASGTDGAEKPTARRSARLKK